MSFLFILCNSLMNTYINGGLNVEKRLNVKDCVNIGKYLNVKGETNIAKNDLKFQIV